MNEGNQTSKGNSTFSLLRRYLAAIWTQELPERGDDTGELDQIELQMQAFGRDGRHLTQGRLQVDVKRRRSNVSERVETFLAGLCLQLHRVLRTNPISGRCAHP